MKALLVALLICLGCQVALAAPCQAVATRVAVATSAAPHPNPCKDLAQAATGAAGTPAPMQKVAVRAPAAEKAGFLAPSAGMPGAPDAAAASSGSGSPADFAGAGTAPKPKEPPAQGPRGRSSLLLVGVALMAGIALRRYGAGRG